MGKPEQINSIIDVMRGSRLQKSLSASLAISYWNEIVGQSIALHCTPSEFSNGILTVECDSAAWCSQIAENQTLLLVRMSEKIGGSIIKQLRPVIRKQPLTKVSGKTEVPTDANIPPKLFAWAETVSQTAPFECRESFMRAMLAVIKNKLKNRSRQ
jgi:hypothetical protein